MTPSKAKGTTNGTPSTPSSISPPIPKAENANLPSAHRDSTPLPHPSVEHSHPCPPPNPESHRKPQHFRYPCALKERSNLAPRLPRPRLLYLPSFLHQPKPTRQTPHAHRRRDHGRRPTLPHRHAR